MSKGMENFIETVQEWTLPKQSYYKGKVSSKEVLDSLALTAARGDRYICPIERKKGKKTIVEERMFIFDGKTFIDANSEPLSQYEKPAKKSK